MALTSGNTLSLNALAGATGFTQNSNVSLGAIEGSPTAGENISLSSMALGGSGTSIGSVGSISGYTYAVENTNETYTLGFVDAGSRFASKIGNRAANFTWSVASGTTISLSSNNGSSAVFSVSNRTNAPTQTILQNISSNTIRVVFNDGFNDHAVGYNTNKDKPVYSVDSYDGNSTALCLTADTGVTLLDGTTIEIGDIEEGMKLRGYILGGLLPAEEQNLLDWSSDNLESFETEVSVVNVVFSFAERIYNINNGHITATAEHPFVVKDATSDIYKFKTVHTLQVGDSLIKGDGEHVEITSIEIEEGTREIVSIDVDGSDTYLANGYITHNKGGDVHTDLGTPGVPTSLAYTVVNGENKNLTWVAGSSSGTTGITAYDVQVDNNSDFSSPALNYTEYSSTTLNIVALASGTYYLRVRCIDHGLKSSWTQIGPFSHTIGIGL